MKLIRNKKFNKSSKDTVRKWSDDLLRKYLGLSVFQSSPHISLNKRDVRVSTNRV
jgi:hypothetical protein